MGRAPPARAPAHQKRHCLHRRSDDTTAATTIGGAVYALCGFTLSTLNLYVFLQALALAPLVAGTLRRAATRGGRAVIVAAAVLALALTTLAVEFVGQALLLGAAFWGATWPVVPMP